MNQEPLLYADPSAPYGFIRYDPRFMLCYVCARRDTGRFRICTHATWLNGRVLGGPAAALSRARLVLSMGLAAGCVRARSSSSPLRGGHCPPLAASTSRLEVWLRCSVHVGCGTPLFRRVVGCRRPARVREGHAEARRRVAGSALHRAWRGRRGEAEAAGAVRSVPRPCLRTILWPRTATPPQRPRLRSAAVPTRPLRSQQPPAPRTSTWVAC